VRIETICTGDELLTGLTSDTNSRTFQALLLDLTGLTVRRSVVVGDVREDIIEALDAAAARCDAVLVSGGLGPTSDDLTAACAADAAGVELVESPEALAHLRARFAARGLAVTPNNLRQALVPRGAEVVLNPEGSAPLIIQQRGGCTFFFVPGVPREYHHLTQHHVVPRLAARLHGAPVRVLKLLKVVGLPESHLDARMTPLASKHPRLTFGYRTHPPENHLKLLAEAPTRAEALAALAAAELDARAVLGSHCFGADEESLAGAALQCLRQRQERLVLAESCTGGLVGALLTEVPGASEVLFGGVITYLDAAKLLWAEVPLELVSSAGAVSRACALAMAAGVREASGVAWSLSVTGFAGPDGGTADEPVGAVYVAVVGPGVQVVERHFFPGDRERVRRFAAHAALDLLRRTAQAQPG
jgi:nicotinamide-nucleotide amidase